MPSRVGQCTNPALPAPSPSHPLCAASALPTLHRNDPDSAWQMSKAPPCSWVHKCSACHIGIVWEALPASTTSGCSSAEPAPRGQVRSVSSSCHNCKPRYEAALRDNQNIKHQRVCSVAFPTEGKVFCSSLTPVGVVAFCIRLPGDPFPALCHRMQSKSKLDTLHSMQPCLLTTAGSKIAVIPPTWVRVT